MRLNLSSNSKLTICLVNLCTFVNGISSSNLPVIHGCCNAYSTVYLFPGFKLHNYSIKLRAKTDIYTCCSLSILSPLNSLIFCLYCCLSSPFSMMGCFPPVNISNKINPQANTSIDLDCLAFEKIYSGAW